MIESMTVEELAKAKEEVARDLAETMARARRHPPRLEGIPPPINARQLMEMSPGPLYEGFEEDIKRMRRGPEPPGPGK